MSTPTIRTHSSSWPKNPSPDSATHLLIGKNHFMLGDYKKATDEFDKAIALAPNSSEAELCVAAPGRRAENNSLMAVVYAGKARQSFEMAVALDPHNGEAKNDLFNDHLNAPGFLGGGIEKAQAAARAIATERPAEYEFEEAQLAEKRNDLSAAEAHLRRAVELAPTQPGRVVDLARFVAKHGRLEEATAVLSMRTSWRPTSRALPLRKQKPISRIIAMPKKRALLQRYLKDNRRRTIHPDRKRKSC